MNFNLWTCCAIMVVAGISYDAFRDYNKTQVELAKANQQKCECK